MTYPTLAEVMEMVKKRDDDILMLAKRMDALEATVKRLDGKSWGKDE